LVRITDNTDQRLFKIAHATKRLTAVNRWNAATT